jgi:hypothetical protein
MSNRFDYNGRLPLNLIIDKTKEALPEHFATEYPDLVKFLDIYYDFMEKDDEGYSYFIQGLYQARDLSTTQLSSLDNIFKEIGNNSQSADFFADPRFIAKVIASFYKAKGSKISAEGFFRAFFGEEASIVYPKNNMFIVNDSRLGTDSLKYIQDDKRYQIHSILIQSGIPLAKWKDLFKLFVHPAGWYLAGDVVIEGIYNLSASSMPIALLDSAAGTAIFEETAFATLTQNQSITGIIIDDNDSDSLAERVSLIRQIQLFNTLTIAGIADQYNSIIEFADENSPTFDEDSDGIIRAVDFSNTIETMDMNKFDYGNPLQYQDSA